MKIKSFETEKYINTLIPFKNPLLIYGSDEGLVEHRTNKIINTFLKGDKQNALTTFDNKGSNQINFEDIISTKSLFSNKEVIKVTGGNDKIIEKLNSKLINSESLLVIINAGELLPRSKLRKLFESENNMGIIACYKIDSLELKKIIIDYINKNKLKVNNEAVIYLTENLGQNYQIIINELNKLLLIKEERIDFENIKNLICSNGSSSYEEIIFSFLTGNNKYISNSFNFNIKNIYEANSFISNTKNLLLIIGKAITSYDTTNIDYVVNTFMPKYLFKNKKNFTNIIVNKSAVNIVKSLEIISEVEKKIRKNQNLYKIILLRGMLNVSKVMR